MKIVISAGQCSASTVALDEITIELENGDKFFIAETSEGIKITGSNPITDYIHTRQSPESVEVLLRS